jgi:uncharacterized membrane protein YozB (DUF420 family)
VTSSSTNLQTDSGSARVFIYVLSAVVTVVALAVVKLTPQEPPSGAPSLLANVNALLNAAAGCFLVLGFICIRQGKREAHKICMSVAFGISTLFLCTYLLHHAQVGSVPFRGEGWLRSVYFTILIPHIVLAALVLPLALFTLYRGLSGRFALHRKIARVTLPVWLFVSFSGVVVYWMLYYAV